MGGLADSEPEPENRQSVMEQRISLGTNGFAYIAPKRKTTRRELDRQRQFL